ncbi:DUF5133 domain-containing protein [Streptomyces sp. NPDC005423]|uniref:DUF5133 domain-containing protein n=1 Tax=Streptomyces sp. NPDC005423 TaxID=3155343 RepID=UPI0033B839BC
MLLPARAEVARQLRRYRAWERLMLASPADRTVRTAFEDTGYTLCVLMGERCAREAADAAERYLLSGAGAFLKGRAGRRPEREGQPRTAVVTHRGKTVDRRSPATR